MNPLGHRILEILQANPNGHSMALNVFNVLNRDGYTSFSKIERPLGKFLRRAEVHPD
jgi:hypothetical protein